MPLSVLSMDTDEHNPLRDTSGSSETSLRLSTHSPSFSTSYTAHVDSIRNSYDDWERTELDKDNDAERDREIELEIEIEKEKEKEREREMEIEREAEERERSDELRMSPSSRKGKKITENLNLLNRAALWLSRDNSTLGLGPAPLHAHGPGHAHASRAQGQGSDLRLGLGLGLGGHTSAPVLADISSSHNSPSDSNSSGSFSERQRSLSSPTLSSSSRSNGNGNGNSNTDGNGNCTGKATRSSSMTGSSSSSGAMDSPSTAVAPPPPSLPHTLSQPQSEAQTAAVTPVRKLLRTRAVDLNLSKLAPIVTALQKNPLVHQRTTIPRHRQHAFTPTASVPALQLSGLFHAVSDDDASVMSKTKGGGQGQGQRPPIVPLLLLGAVSPQQRLLDNGDGGSGSGSRPGSGSATRTGTGGGSGREGRGGVGLYKQSSSTSMPSRNSITSFSKLYPVITEQVHCTARYVKQARREG